MSRVVNVEICWWEAPCAHGAVWGMRYANECCYCDWADSVSDSWLRGRGRDGARMRNSETENRQQRHLSQPGRRNVGKWGSIFGHFELLSEVRVWILCSLCMMSVMAWWWGPGWCYDDNVLPLSHLVVTNKSNKNPQLIRSDSVQNRFFSPLADRVGADL